MLRRVANRLKSAFSVVIFGLRILRWCGLRYFFKHLGHEVYGCTIFIVEEHALEVSILKSPFNCTLSLATSADLDELFSSLPHESREGRYQLLLRRWYHERGFGDCYIARTVDTNEICHALWMVTSEHVRQLGWGDKYPLAEDQVMRENLYTIEKFRRRGIRTTILSKNTEIALGLGYTRVKGYVDETNIAELKAAQKDGDLVYARVRECRILFYASRKTLKRYDPPVPIKLPETRLY